MYSIKVCYTSSNHYILIAYQLWQSVKAGLVRSDIMHNAYFIVKLNTRKQFTCLQTSHLDILHGIVHCIEQFCQLFPPLMLLVTPFLCVYIHAGVKHPSIVCDACRENGITGIRWKCVRCYDFDLCNICYSVGKHSLEHEFSRIDVLEGPRYMLHTCVL